ncbi:hypothetical protein [Streptomyces sp. NPDC004267]|uniref:hypothetical protein n=1 Tax=Streptomyces sp. NPDC004267 TaxID=3364694 RepID=UPI0036ADC5EC
MGPPDQQPERAGDCLRLRIVELLEDFGQDPDAVAEFAAVAAGGQRGIAWDEFCSGRSRVDQLAQALIDGTARQILHAVWDPASMADTPCRGEGDRPAGTFADGCFTRESCGAAVGIRGR